MTPKIILKSGKDSPLLRRHPWVFSGAIAQTAGSPKNGDFVEVCSFEKKSLGAGFFSDSSIAVKLLGFSPLASETSAMDLIRDSLTKAVLLRKKLELFHSSDTDSFRLVNAEGDFLPGLVIDVYGSTAVMQCHSVGMYGLRDQIAQAVVEISQGRITHCYDKSGETLSESDGNASLVGNESAPKIIKENGLSFEVDWEKGQKTGFFLDQRANRKLIGTLAKDKRVLNAFSYTGGFSTYALQGGACSVISVDSSKPASELATKNVALNFSSAIHQSVSADCFEYLSETPEKFDLIIIDPPAFAKHRNAIKAAIKGYRSLNKLAIAKVESSGIVATFSCSQLVSREEFESAVMSGAIDTGRTVKVLYRLSQAPCHPTSIFHPEGPYLKGLILEVV